jgi:hypothetical protein
MSKIFVRHRRHVGQGSGRPRFAIVAAQGVDLRVFKTRVRRAEVEKIAAETGAEIVYLPRGERAASASAEAASAEADAGEGEGRKGRRRRRERDED